MKTSIAKKTSTGTNGKRFKGQLAALWNEFKRFKYGMVGLALFMIFVLIVIFEPLIIPFKETGTRWRDITYWQDNPVNAAPAWTNWFSAKDKTPQETLKATNIVKQEEPSADMTFIDAEIHYNYKYDDPPTDMAFRATVMGDVSFMLSLVRPDGIEIPLFDTYTSSSTPNDFRVSFNSDALDNIFEFATQYEDPTASFIYNKSTLNAMNVLFSKAQYGILDNPEPLKGEYVFKITAATIGSGDVSNLRIEVAGKVFGILGTDNAKRDLWSGIICGTKWALLIGLSTSLISVFIGVLYGVVSAYFGGVVDMIMMRIFEIVNSMPLLPIIIVMSAIFKPNLWTMIILMCLFFWTGSVRTVRSMGLQIKEETYIEAARALNASNGRIIFKHMLPQLIPYSFASMALSVPGAILYESTISLLGLGDATIVTWGQILQAASSGGAVLHGLWWWVVPPGVCMALMGMTFAFIGFAMDTILNPKLRTR
ncbi:MAG: ABC transporter permease [Bacillota bacterium]|jgi:peptide/nickel transport system permease protein